MAVTVNMHKAKERFSKLLERVRLGEEVIIAEAGKPIARLVPVEISAMDRQPGTARGMIEIADNFSAPLPHDTSEALAHPVTVLDAER